MLTPTALLDMLQRSHFGIRNLLDHCRRLTDEELHRELPGIGFPTVCKQLFHMINAEQYWLMVLRGRFADGETFTEQEKYDWTQPNFRTVDDLEDYRRRVLADTEAYLSAATPESLAAAGEYAVDPGIAETLVPELVITRVITHYFHHRGLVAAMCRMLGCPVPEGRAFLDYPLEDQEPAWAERAGRAGMRWLQYKNGGDG
jgi:uncharacterized damage-inducible protein DinB